MTGVWPRSRPSAMTSRPGAASALVPLRLPAREEVRGLHLPPVDAVAGDAVKVDVDVDAVLLAELHGTVDLLQRLFADARPVVAGAPDPAPARAAGRVEG